MIPVSIIAKAPTAELRENQKDQDSLPPYDELDAILECLVEKEMRVAEIVALGHDRATVKRVEHLLYIAEYKRRQAAPGVKITLKNFGRDRRYPITNRFRDQLLERPPRPAQFGTGAITSASCSALPIAGPTTRICRPVSSAATGPAVVRLVTGLRHEIAGAVGKRLRVFAGRRTRARQRRGAVMETPGAGADCAAATE